MVLLAWLSNGCSLGLHQTAKTLQQGEIRAGGGLLVMKNKPADVLEDSPEARAQGGDRMALFPELAVRAGVGQRTDMGIGLHLGLGLRLDAKHNLIDETKPYAIAPRLGFGFVFQEAEIFTWMAGLIGSYQLARWVSFYLGTTFVNHHVSRTQTPVLSTNERLAERSNWGDGLLQGALGLQLGPRDNRFFLEYGRWLPLQNDPGDSFRLVPTHLLSLTLHGCSMGCEGGTR
jgi:hypothetical protein